MSCRLSLFGPPALLDHEGRPVPVPVKTFALAAYLILAGGNAPVSRTALRQFFWGGADAKTAAANLRKFLLRVRLRQREYGVELIQEERNHVRLARTAETDLGWFLKTVGGGGSADLASLCDVYRGDLVEGLVLEETEAREWLQVQRTKLRDVFTSAVASRLEAAAPDADKCCSALRHAG